MDKRTILIFEDNPDFRMIHKTVGYMALNELRAEGLEVDLEMLEAEGLAQGVEILEKKHIDFAIVDLAQSRKEEVLNENMRDQKGDPGGLRLLAYLRHENYPTLAVVVSGETLESYRDDALDKYQALNFYQKGKYDNIELINAVKAAMWYLHAIELKETDPQAAHDSWTYMKEAAHKAHIRESAFPENLEV